MLGPVEAGCFADSFLKIADQTADHVPLRRPPDLNVSVLVDANNGRRIDTGGDKIIAMQLTIVDDLLERLASHLNEFHQSVSLLTLKWLRGRPSLDVGSLAQLRIGCLIDFGFSGLWFHRSWFPGFLASRSATQADSSVISPPMSRPLRLPFREATVSGQTVLAQAVLAQSAPRIETRASSERGHNGTAALNRTHATRPVQRVKRGSIIANPRRDFIDGGQNSEKS